MKPLASFASVPTWIRDADWGLSFRYTDRLTVPTRQTDLAIEDYRFTIGSAVLGWRVGFDMNQQLTVDHARARTGEQDRRSHGIGLNLSRSYTGGTKMLFMEPGWVLTPNFAWRQGRDQGFGTNFRSTSTHNYDLGAGLESASRLWNLRVRYSIQDREEGRFLGAIGSSRNTDLNIAASRKIPVLEGGDVTATWSRKNFNSEGQTQDFSTDAVRFEMRLPF